MGYEVHCQCLQYYQTCVFGRQRVVYCYPRALERYGHLEVLPFQKEEDHQVSEHDGGVQKS